MQLELGVASVSVTAGDGADTVVDVRPTDPGNRADVLAAERTRVDPAGDQVTVTSRQSWRDHRPWGWGGSVDVRVELPAGSQLTGRIAAGALRSTGRLGACRLTTGAGSVDIEHGADVRLRTGAGDLFVGRADSALDVATGSGAVRIGQVDGSAVVKNSNGATRIDHARGDLRVQAANGSIVLDRADGSVVAKTANGDVRVGEARGGSVVAETGCGSVELALGHGRAAWLDLQSHFGRVVNGLAESGPPAPGEPTVEVRARTAMGDITVGRSAEHEPEKMSVPADRLPL